MATVEMMHYKRSDEDCAEFFDTLEEANSFVDDMIESSSCFFMYAVVENGEVVRLWYDMEMNKYRTDADELLKQYSKKMARS